MKIILENIKSYFVEGLQWYKENNPLFSILLICAVIYVWYQISKYILPFIAAMYQVGGLLLLFLGVGPALVLLLFWMGLIYFRLPLITEKKVLFKSSNRTVNNIVIAISMFVGWISIEIVLLGYQYFMSSIN